MLIVFQVKCFVHFTCDSGVFVEKCSVELTCDDVLGEKCSVS